MVLKDEVIEFKYVFEDETGKHINKNREHVTYEGFLTWIKKNDIFCF